MTPPYGPSARRGPSRSTLALLVVVVAGLVVGAAGQLIHVPYVVFSPGPAQNTLGSFEDREVISVKGAKTYPTDGSLDFTTVSLYGGPDHPVSLWRYLKAKTDSNSVIQPEKEVFGDKTGAEIKQESSAQMTGSQQSAEVVGIRATGAKVGEQVYVGAVGEGEPAAGKLKARDRIVSINAQATPTMNAVQKQMQKVSPGEAAKVTVVRGGDRRTVSVKTRAADGRAVMGIQIAPKFDFPFKVRINAGEVGGPSAGLMFSLAIYDKLTPGALTKGEKFAGTGTMGFNGEVGPIGGIRQKLVGARSSGVDHFLAPAQNCDEVKGHVPDGLSVYKVSTFDQARTVIQKVAAGATKGLPSC